MFCLTACIKRGNLNTRLKKLEESGQYDAIILAKAGLDRMNWQDKTDQVKQVYVINSSLTITCVQNTLDMAILVLHSLTCI